MDSKTFRSLGTYAVDEVAKFIDEFPEFYVVMRIRPKDSPFTVVIGFEKAEDEDDEEKEAS